MVIFNLGVLVVYIVYSIYVTAYYFQCAIDRRTLRCVPKDGFELCTLEFPFPWVSLINFMTNNAYSLLGGFTGNRSSVAIGKYLCRLRAF